MGKRGRGRPRKIRREEVEEIEEDGECISVLRKHRQQSPPDPSSPPPPPPPLFYCGFKLDVLGCATNRPYSLFGLRRYTTRQSVIGLRSQTQNVKAVPSASSSSSSERSVLAEKVDQPSSPMAEFPTSVLPQTENSLSTPSRRGTSRSPSRSPVWNVKSVPCASSASTLERNALAEIVDQQGMAEIPSSNLLQAQEPLSGVQTFANSSAPDQSMGGYNQKDKPSSPASSFNYTEIAAIVGNDSFDPDEVASQADPALVTVNGYQIKEEMAALLRSIISKYGDIGKECTFQSPENRSYLMEKVCGIYQSLEKTEPTLFTPVELKSMLHNVDDLETVRIDMRWLRQRLDEINEGFQSSKGYSDLKEALARNLVATEGKKKELDELVVEREKINEALLSTRAKLKFFYRGSLVDGLL